MKALGILYDEKLFGHMPPVEHHHEHPDRLRQIYARLDAGKYQLQTEKIDCTPVSQRLLERVHSPFYLKQLKEATQSDNPFSHDQDTFIVEDSFTVASLAAGGCCNLIDALFQEQIAYGFALTRPPGHHAEVGRAMGFCLLNHAAISAQYLKDHYHLKRILIVDYDVHHGNGLQDIFYGSSEVFVCSIHQKELYPFSGAADETGMGKGAGFHLNIPVSHGCGDEEYLYAFGNILQPIIQKFQPECTIVSAGFDGHQNDPISGTTLSTQGYYDLAKTLKYLVNQNGEGKLLFVLEGGYCPKTLEECVFTTCDALLQAALSPSHFVFSRRMQTLIETKLPFNFRAQWGID